MPSPDASLYTFARVSNLYLLVWSESTTYRDITDAMHAKLRSCACIQKASVFTDTESLHTKDEPYTGTRSLVYGMTSGHPVGVIWELES